MKPKRKWKIPTPILFLPTFILCYFMAVYVIGAVVLKVYEDTSIVGGSEIVSLILEAAFYIAIVPTVVMFVAEYVRKKEEGKKPSSEEIKRRKEEQDSLEYQAVLRNMPYKRDWILTIPEKKFWDVLRTSVDDQRYILIKPTLKEFIKTVDYQGRINRRAWREIAQKHVDFLVCERWTMRPLYAIEYDGDTHDPRDPRNAATVQSDRFKDQLFAHVGLPLIRIPYGTSEEGIHRMIEAVENGKI